MRENQNIKLVETSISSSSHKISLPIHYFSCENKKNKKQKKQKKNLLFSFEHSNFWQIFLYKLNKTMLFCSKQKHMQIEKKSLHFRISLRRVQLCIHQVTITIHYVHHSYSLYGPLFVYPFWGSSQYMGKKHNCSASNKAKIIQTKNSKNVLVSEASDIGTLMEIPEAKKKFEIKICWITVVFFERSSPWTKVCAVKKKKNVKKVWRQPAMTLKFSGWHNVKKNWY